MAMDNTITVSGSLGRDPELRYTTSGRPVASAGVAVNRRWQQDGEWKESTTWLNVVAWGDLGEHWAASCSKGDRVIITGRIEVRTYEDREGNSKYITELVADDIGPSLKWAEAQVERVHRDSSSSSDKGPKPDPVYGDEEPF